jgi:hypothetical protein
VSRGTFVPLISRDVLDAAVVCRSVLEGSIEEVRPICGALDVLAQIILSMTAAEAWSPDALHALLRDGALARRDAGAIHQDAFHPVRLPRIGERGPDRVLARHVRLARLALPNSNTPNIFLFSLR